MDEPPSKTQPDQARDASHPSPSDRAAPAAKQIVDAVAEAIQTPLARGATSESSSFDPRSPLLERKGHYSDWLDKGFFLTMAIAGVAAIVFVKLVLDLTGWPATVPALAILGTYAALSFTTKQFRAHPDRIGDNCYYMGFVFTLGSLAVALVQLQQVSGDARGLLLDALIGNFGVALFSTIMGIVLRVFFTQFRREIEDEEEAVREELHTTAARLKDQLGQAVSDLESFRVRTAQVLDEQVRVAADEFARVQRSLAERSAVSAHKLATKHEEAADQLVAAGAKMVDAVSVIGSQISQSSEALAKTNAHLITSMSEHGETVLAELARVQKRVTTNWEATSSEIKGVQQSIIDGFREIIDPLAANATQFGKQASKITSELNRLIGRLEKIEVPPNLLIRSFEQLEARLTGTASSLERIAEADRQRGDALGVAVEEFGRQVRYVADVAPLEATRVAAGRLAEQIVSLSDQVRQYQSVLANLTHSATEERQAIQGIRAALKSDADQSAEAMHALQQTLTDIARGISLKLSA